MNRAFVIVLLLLAFLVGISSTGYSDESEDKKARQSFETLIRKMLNYGADKVSGPYETRAGFRLKKWIRNSDVSYDIQKTNSIVSPYTATLKLHANCCLTEPAARVEEIKSDFNCESDPKVPWVQKYTFAYQDGVWELKESGFNVLFNLKGQDFNLEKADIKLNGDNMLDYIFNATTIKQLQK